VEDATGDKSTMIINVDVAGAIVPNKWEAATGLREKNRERTV
jgi:hypothetical protein